MKIRNVRLDCPNCGAICLPLVSPDRMMNYVCDCGTRIRGWLILDVSVEFPEKNRVKPDFEQEF